MGPTGNEAVRILAHRGVWSRPEERNSLAALERAIAMGFGIETDLRDDRGTIVISHDPPAAGALPFAELAERWVKGRAPGALLALNVKSDGLQTLARAELERAGVAHADIFFFDMSVPDARGYVRAGLPIYTRQSDLEAEPLLYSAARGVWLDTFEREWLSAAALSEHARAGKEMCIVSPELHGRPHLDRWSDYRAFLRSSAGLVALCTDHPSAARDYFHG